METSDANPVPHRGCPEHRRQRSFQLGRPKRGDTRLNAHGWVGLSSSRREGPSHAAMDAVWNRDTPADKDGPDTYPLAADAWVHAAIVRAGHAGVLLGDNPGRSERVPGPREVGILWNALPRFDHDAFFTTVASEFTECRSKVVVSTLPRAVLWDFFATVVHLRHKLLILRLVKRLLATVVDEAAHTVRWICDAPHEDHGITPLVLERLCGGLGTVEKTDFKFAQAVGFLVARCNKVTMVTALFHAVLHSPAFAGEVGDFWRSVLHSDTVRHVLAVCVLAAMDALFAGTWYMYNGEAPLPEGEKCLGLSRSERQVRYNRWRTFCDLALTIVGDAMPSEVVVHTPRTLQTGRSGGWNSGRNRVVPILRQTGVSPFGWGGGLAFGESAGGFKTSTVPTLRIAFEASRVHDWPYLAMMGLPSRTFDDVALFDTFVHIYRGEPEPCSGKPYDPLEPPPVNAARRLRFLELTYRKLIENAHDARATLSERHASSKFLSALWTDIAVIEPEGIGIVEERRPGDFERLVRRLLRCTPPPEAELAASGAFTVCSVVAAMADCVAGDRHDGRAASTTVYLDAIAAIADADVRFLRAARSLAGWSSDGFFASMFAKSGEGAARALEAIPVRQLRAVFDLVVCLTRECDRVGKRCKGLPHPDSDPESDGLPHDLVAEFHAEPSASGTASDPGETQRLLAAAQLLAALVAKKLDSLSAEPSPIRDQHDGGWNFDAVGVFGKIVVTIDCLDWLCASIAPTEAKSAIEFRDWSCTELRPEHIGFVEAHTTGAAMGDEAEEGAAPPSPVGRRVGRAGVDHTASVLSRFIIYRAPRACLCPQWWALTPREAAAFDEDTSTALRQMLRIAPWSQEDLQWALAVAASWCHTAAAEVLLQPFHDHPHGLSAASVPDYMLECAQVVKVESHEYGRGNHTPTLGTVEEAREWLVDVAEPLWALGGPAVAGLGAGMKRKHA